MNNSNNLNIPKAPPNKSRDRVYDIALVALFAALMAICSWISIPATVPFTLQTLGVFLAIGLLGGKRGTVSILCYLLLGAVVLPVFASFAGGLGYMMGPTGGYIIGFLCSALSMWIIEKVCGRSYKVLVFSMFVGLIICYIFGTAWFMYVYSRSAGPIGLWAALSLCVIPYIVPDITKILIAFVLCKKLRRFVGGF